MASKLLSTVLLALACVGALARPTQERRGATQGIVHDNYFYPRHEPGYDQEYYAPPQYYYGGGGGPPHYVNPPPGYAHQAPPNYPHQPPAHYHEQYHSSNEDYHHHPGAGSYYGCPFCPYPLGECNGECRKLDTNLNCGACGNRCPRFVSNCVNGACECKFGLSLCDNDGNPRCVNLQTNNKNCGTCGNKCTGGQTCRGGVCDSPCNEENEEFCSGTCTDVSDDPANCGDCGVTCTEGTQDCQDKSCCLKENEACTQGNPDIDCCSGLKCDRIGTGSDQRRQCKRK